MNDFFKKIKNIREKINTYDISYYYDELADKKKRKAAFGLESQAKEFLSRYYTVNINNDEDLSFYLKLWQYESLLHTCKHAQSNSFAYKTDLANFEFSEEFIYLNSIKKARYSDKNKIIKKLDDAIYALLTKIPLLSSENLIENNDKYLAVSQTEVQSIVSVETSGTSSNQSKRIYSTIIDLESTIDFYFYGMLHILKKENNKIAMLYSSEREGSVGNLMIKAMEKLQIECKIFPFTDDFDMLIQELIEFQPTTIIGIPTHTLTLSALAKETSLKKSIYSILLSGDTASQTLKNAIANNFECKVFEHYGLTEFGLAGAVEDNNFSHLTNRNLDLFVEILDENGKHIPKGNYGEVVITSLTREAMPLLRYKTCDIGCLCENKSSFTVLDSIEIIGRESQSIKFSKNIEKSKFTNIHYSTFQEIILEFPQVIDFELFQLGEDFSNKAIFIIGLDFEKSTNDNLIRNIYKKIQMSFEKRYDVKYLSTRADFEILQDKNKACFCFVKMEELKKYILQSQRDTDEYCYNKINSFINYNNFDDLLKNKLKTKNQLSISLKKKIYFLEMSYQELAENLIDLTLE